jgi:hypothetical protein
LFACLLSVCVSFFHSTYHFLLVFLSHFSTFILCDASPISRLIDWCLLLFIVVVVVVVAAAVVDVVTA